VGGLLSGDLVKVEYEGSLIYVKINKDGLYICPICEDALFHTPRDLMLHIVAHAKGYTERKVKVRKIEESG
jgi:hypothetical protein